MQGIKCDHIHLRSKDPENAIEFYIKNFHARIKRELTVMGVKHIDLNLGGMTLRVSPETTNEATKRQMETSVKHGAHNQPKYSYGLHHFGLVVDNLEELVSNLKSDGVKFTTDLTLASPGISIAFIEAPDNVLIELIQRSDTYLGSQGS